MENKIENTLKIIQKNLEKSQKIDPKSRKNIKLQLKVNQNFEEKKHEN